MRKRAMFGESRMRMGSFSGVGDSVLDLRALNATTFDSPTNWYVHLDPLRRLEAARCRTLTVTSGELLPHTLEGIQEAKPTAAELAAHSRATIGAPNYAPPIVWR